MANTGGLVDLESLSTLTVVSTSICVGSQDSQTKSHCCTFLACPSLLICGAFQLKDLGAAPATAAVFIFKLVEFFQMFLPRPI